MINPVTMNTHPTRIATAANALRIQMHQERQAISEETNLDNALKRLETLAEGMVVLASMVEALAAQAGRAR